ncbi:MAG: T9SS type A sorting domain-containing protein [Bacteroidota bacterium]
MKKLLVKYLISALFIIGCLAGSEKALGQTIALLNNTGFTTSSTLYNGQQNLTLYGVRMTPNASITLGTLIFSSSNANANGYFTNAELWVSTSPTFASATQIVAATGQINGTDITFTNIGKAMTSGTAYYYYLVMDCSVSFGLLPSTETFGVTGAKGPSNTPTYTLTGGPAAGISYSLSLPDVSVANLTGGLTTGTLSYGQTGIAIFGCSVTVTGALTTGKITFAHATDAQSIFGNPTSTAKLFRSTTSSTYPTGFVQVATGTITPTTTQFNYNETFPGTATTVNYFVVVDYNGACASPSTVQYTVTTAQSTAFFISSVGSTNYPSSTNVSGTSFTVAKTVNWTGATNNSWTTLSNYATICGGAPSSLSSTDVIQIGVVSYTTAPTIITNNTTIGKLVFGSAQASTLNLSAAVTTGITVTQGITTNASSTATITGAAAAPVITIPVGALSSLGASSTLNTNAQITNNDDMDIAAGATLNLTATSGKLSNAATAIISNSGTMTIAGASTNTGTINITGAGTLTFSSTLNNASGTIGNTGSGTINFGAAVTNTSGSITHGGSALMTFTGAQTNAGSIIQSSTGNITFTTTLSNTSTINQTGTGLFTTTGLFTNSGTVSASSTGGFTLAGITNTGTSLTLGGGTNTITGAVSNASTKTITLAGNTTFSAAAAITNSGIFAGGTGNTVYGAAFTNNGASCNFTASAGTNDFNSTFSNAKAATFPSGSTTTIFGNFSNGTAGTVTATGSSITFDGTTSPQTVTNTNTGTPVTFNDVTFSGSGTKQLIGTGSYITSGTVDMSGTAIFTTTTAPFTNNGTFNTNGAATTFGTTFTNTGTFNHSGSGALICTGAVTNTGTINKTATGSITFSSTVSNTTATGKIIQNGTAGTITFSQAETALLTSGGEIDIQNSAGVVFSSSLVNSGTIAGTGAGDLTVTTNLTNSSGASITQNSTGDMIFGTVATANTISNTGTISQTGSGAFTNNGTGLTTNNSTGQITLGSGTSTFAGGITNASGGTFTFGSGTTTVTGALINTGTMAGGSGSTTFTAAFTNSVTTGIYNGGSSNTTFNGAFINNNTFALSTGSSDFNNTFTNNKTVTATGGTTTFSNSFNNVTPATFIASGGTVVLDQQSAQTISNTTAATPVAFYNLTVTNANVSAFIKTLAGAGNYTIASTGLLSVTGKTTFATAGKLTLLSDANGSASVDKITGTFSTSTPPIITGNVIVQRYLTGGASYSRGYRLLSAPVSTTNINLIIPTLTYLPNTSGTTGGGFTQTGSPSLYLYRENVIPYSTSFTSSGNYRSIKSIGGATIITIDNALDAGNFNLPAGNGLLFFFRGGPGTVSPFVSTSTALTATLSQTGVLNQGDITVKHWWYTVNAGSGLMWTTTTGNSVVRGYNLVGNPYASSIDWDTFGTAITATNVGSKIWIYNPKTKGYAAYIPGVGGTGFNGGSPNIIPSGEGFFVKASAASPTLTFTENAKVNSNVVAANLLLSAAVAPPVKQYLRLQLFKDTSNIDETLVFFKNTAKAKFLDAEDAEYLKGNNLLNLASRSTDNVALAINQMPFPQQRQVIPLNVTITSNGSYQLNLTEVKNIPAEYGVWLIDAYKKDSLDIKNNPTYSFTATTADTNSFGSKRFSLVLHPNPSLAVHLLNFTGTKTVKEVKLEWTVENEASYTRYVLERSINGGKNFTVLDSLTSASLGVYTDIDPNPAKGQNLYRLKQIDVLGNITYSSVVPIMYADNVVNSIATNLISVYPNPVNSTLNLAITPATAVAANYKITIINISGSVVKSTTSGQATWQGDVSTLLPGTYFVEVTNIKTNTITGKSTFIKL